ncbi:hypothetical protein [Streptomyces sp. ISL-11]|uniref:hypothetical protein n=1 Tax=Streptomyces sp. ISL-11 TaxID=2819174 RepID=UPI001BE9668B|nr:hypothetical protein [Streptomyces sp. ISL-11]MBT2382062.1 hypothetical protein [Streptomyces sp. ISL-11]
MNVPRRTRLAVTGTVCGVLALTVAGTATAAPAGALPRPGTQAPAPDSLRRAAAEGAKAIDINPYAETARRIVRDCATAPADGTCATARTHLDGLTTARTVLDEQSRAAVPDMGTVIGATADAVAATAHLAKGGVVPDGVRVPTRTDRAGGLVSVVTSALTGLVSAMRPVVVGINALVKGVVRGVFGKPAAGERQFHRDAVHARPWLNGPTRS